MQEALGRESSRCSLTLEDRLHNPLTEVLSRRQYSQAALYRAALRDTRFSSGLGMIPPAIKPKKSGSVAWLLFKFGFVGGLGLFLNVYLMYVLMTLQTLTGFLTAFLGNSYYLVDAVLSSQAVILVSFLMNEGLVFRGRKGVGGTVRRMVLFNAVSSADLVLRIPLLWGLAALLAVPAWLSNLDSILLTFVGRFTISHKKIWPKRT